MPPETDAVELSALGLSILELLNERPMHPYELAQTMRGRHYDEFIRLNFGSLYHTVESLERDGLIVQTEREKEGRRPERTVYALTDAGRNVLIQAVSDIVARPRREYQHFSAGLMFAHHLDAPTAADLLDQRSLALHAVIAKLSHILGELLASGHPRLVLIELEHKIALIEAERAWVQKIAGEIKNGKLEWKAGMDAGMAGIDAGGERLRRRDGSSAH